jgi:hypothetical protein
VYQGEDGMVRVRGRLAPEVGALLVKAPAAARETVYQQTRRQFSETGLPAADAPTAEPPTLEQQQADALALLAETALHHGIDPGAPGERYQVVVHVEAAVLADPEALRAGASHPPLGPGRRHHAVDPRAAMSPPPPRSTRGGLPV